MRNWLTFFAAIFANACSSGPQLPVVTVPVSVHCQTYSIVGPDDTAGRGEALVATVDGERTYTRRAMGAVSIVDSDCTVAASPTASPTTTGVEAENSGDMAASANVPIGTSGSTP